MDNSKKEAIKITIRRAADFGSRLAIDLAEKFQKESIEAFKWPEKFPITTKRISQLPEINKDTRVAKRAVEAAQAVWREIRHEAISIESFMLANSDYTEPRNAKQQDWSWRELFMEIEQAAGNIFLTDHANEEVAQKNVYDLLRPVKLKGFILEFEDDYNNFLNEVRESIRAKKAISASIRLELICMLNTNTKAAKKLMLKPTKKS